MKSVVFFNQAAADIVHILKIYDQLESSGNYNFKVICFNNKLFCEVYEALSLKNMEILYFPHNYPPFKWPFRRRSWRKKISMALDHIITDNDADIYFTSIYDDFLTPYYVGILAEKGHTVYYLNHYDDCQNISPAKNIPLNKKIFLRLLNYNTGIKYTICNMSGRWLVTRYPKERIASMIELHPTLDSQVCKKYAVKIGNCLGKTALLFTQPNRDHALISDSEYNELQYIVAQRLKDSGYPLAVKGHPALGICEDVRSFADIIIPQIIPGELLDYSQIDSCYAFITVALASTAKLNIPSYSFLPLMKTHESIYYQETISFISNTGEGKIKLLNSLKEIQ